MYASSNRAAFIAELMADDINEIVSRRALIEGDIDGQIADGLVMVLEESAEEENGRPERIAKESC